MIDNKMLKFETSGIKKLRRNKMHTMQQAHSCMCAKLKHKVLKNNNKVLICAITSSSSFIHRSAVLKTSPVSTKINMSCTYDFTALFSFLHISTYTLSLSRFVLFSVVVFFFFPLLTNNFLSVIIEHTTMKWSKCACMSERKKVK
jgi:hypothetical protein